MFSNDDDDDDDDDDVDEVLLMIKFSTTRICICWQRVDTWTTPTPHSRVSIHHAILVQWIIHHSWG